MDTQNKITLAGVIVAIIFGGAGLYIGWQANLKTQSTEVSINQDLTEIKGKIAEFDTIIADEKFLVPCENGSVAILSEGPRDMYMGFIEKENKSGINFGEGDISIECIK